MSKNAVLSIVLSILILPLGASAYDGPLAGFSDAQRDKLNGTSDGTGYESGSNVFNAISNFFQWEPQSEETNQWNYEVSQQLTPEELDPDNICKTKCEVRLSVNKRTQLATLIVNGIDIGTVTVTTGRAGHATPNMTPFWNPTKYIDDKTGEEVIRVYEAYTSKKYSQGGHYRNLGNMPYAVFLGKPTTGIAVHGTGAIRTMNAIRYAQEAGDFARVRRIVRRSGSHGCIRMYPEDAKGFNRFVRLAIRMGGVKSVQVTVR